MITLTTFGLYSLVILIALFSYTVGLIIRGILAEKNEDNFRERIIEIHSAALKEVNHLRKDIRNEMEVRKTAEQLNARLRAEINALQAHGSAPLATGGEESFTEHVLEGQLKIENGELSATGADGAGA